MICPVCGAEVGESKLLCPECGHEFRFIPDFEPEVENQISDTLSEISIDDEDLEELTPEEIEAGYYYDEDGNLFYDGPVFDADGYEVRDDDDYNGPLFDALGNPIDDSEDMDEAGAQASEQEYPVDDGYLVEDYPDDQLDNADQESQDGYREEFGPDDEEYAGDYDEIPDEKSLPEEEEYYEEEYDDIESEGGDTADFGKREELAAEYAEPEEEYSEFDEEYEGDDFYDDDSYDYDDDDIFHQFFLAATKSRFKKLYACLFLIVMLLLAGLVYFVSVRVYRSSSYEYQAGLAEQAYLEGDLDGAIDYMEKALTLSSGDDEMKFKLAQYYFEAFDDEKALLMLWEIAYEKNENQERAYREIISYYEKQSDFPMIESILEACDNETIVNNFRDYLANPPEFSYASGEYDDVISLTLSAGSNGSIYYTTDGHEPTLQSTLYTSPIQLNLGSHEINAIFVNNYGVVSEVAKATYRIYIRVPDALAISVPDGEYTVPMLIETEVPQFCTVYYTTDGTPPTMGESNEYSEGIPMPLGHSHFIFAAISQEGISGDVTECDFDLTIDSELDLQTVIAAFKQYNLNMGRTADIEGHLPGNLTRYTYVIDSAINLDENGKAVSGNMADPETGELEEPKDPHIYYIITEYTVDTSGLTMKTGNYYMVSIEDGFIYKAVKNEGEVIQRGELIPPEAYVAPPPIVPEDNAAGN
ncbi:MAG: chitobiase/beta-hexosaminidase C-terminal domain-containing protein [Lachnospiraceae bacterium]|nr:chitobiase/beta-hexosaminidase C-terminal domain-containing protein [Lachnospiraceae bacterium]